MNACMLRVKQIFEYSESRINIRFTIIRIQNSQPNIRLLFTMRIFGYFGLNG